VRRFQQPNQASEQSALAATAAPNDKKNFALANRKGHIPQDDFLTVAARQAFDLDHGRGGVSVHGA
jgi:hypothetical protein